MSSAPDPSQLPMRIPEVGPFRHLGPEQRRELAGLMERQAARLVASARSPRLQDPRAYVTNTIERVSGKSSFEYRGLRQLIVYCEKAIENLIIDDIRRADQFRDESVTDHDVDISGAANDPATESIARESQMLGLIKEREPNIAKLMERLKRECTPQQRAAFEALVKVSDQSEIYNEFARGQRKGQLDLSPDGVANATGMPIDTVNKHKRALKDIAAKMGSFRRVTADWES